MAKLNKAQRTTLYEALRARVSLFPRDSLRTKLEEADRAYQLADGELDTANTTTYDGVDIVNGDKRPEEEQSRYSEIQNGLTRENIETYKSKFVDIFLSNSKVFSMTSVKSKESQAQQFNAVMQDQSRRMGWSTNLEMIITDVLKYNFCGAAVIWDTMRYNTVEVKADGKRELSQVSWHGNNIKRLDPYNVMFDTTVHPVDIAEHGEWAGYVEEYTQVRLKSLVDLLAADSNMDLFSDSQTEGDNRTVDIYKLGSDSQSSQSAQSHNFEYYTPDIDTANSAKFNPRKDNTGFGGNSVGKPGHDTNTKMTYSVFHGYIRLVPSAFGFPRKGTQDDVQIWEVYILDGIYLLGAKMLTNMHSLLGIAIGQTDSDSNGMNTAGPAQITIPYSKAAKQIMDRMLAGADRAIQDRAVYDEKYIDGDKLSGPTADAKIPLKKSIPARENNGIGNRAYMSIPFEAGAVQQLYAILPNVENSSRQAVGINQAQTGQFVKGNRTLEEFDKTVGNADGKIIMRASFWDSSFLRLVKRMVKYNIIQYQNSTSLVDQESNEEVKVDAVTIASADLEFAIADGLRPTEFMMSPNVQQQLLQLMMTAPDMFQGYDVIGMISHILSQSAGVNMDQYKVQQGGV